MSNDKLLIKGARENNLKEIDCEIPHDQLCVVSGLSGSGKSSFAFHTIYAEGQRRYIETFSPYTRQFLDKVKKPDVDQIASIRPSIAIQQKTRIRSARSTVGSLTNLNEYLKILWANLSEPLCPDCSLPLKQWDTQSLLDYILEKQQDFDIAYICTPIELIGNKRGQLTKKVLEQERERMLTLGYLRYLDPNSGAVISLDDSESTLKLYQERKLLIIIERLKSSKLDPKRIKPAIIQAYEHSHKQLTIAFIGNTKLLLEDFQQDYACPKCSFSLPKRSLSLFSFHHPLGACQSCNGFGRILDVDENLVVPNPTLSLNEGAISCWSAKKASRERSALKEFCANNKISMDKSWSKLSKTQRKLLWETHEGRFRGIKPWFKWLERKIYKMHVRVFLARYRGSFSCPSCKGGRLNDSARAYKINALDLSQLCDQAIESALAWAIQLEASLNKDELSMLDTVQAVRQRLQHLNDLGLPYLSLNRPARTLSGGETQRVNIAAALGSGLVSTQFVLDEPTVGLHPRDTQELLKSLRTLQRRGNSLLVVEHDLDCISEADHIIEVGPGSGEQGGEIVYSGSLSKWRNFPNTQIDLPSRDLSKNRSIQIKNAKKNNLKSISCKIPLNCFVSCTGVSGSGKSTLIEEVLYKAWNNYTIGINTSKGDNAVSGFDNLDQVLLIDQSPLAKSPRANIATYSKIWDQIRLLLAQGCAAKGSSLTKSSFSFNVEGGRCPHCKGAGYLREDMQFLSDAYIPCEVCLGKRFQDPILEVEINGLNAHDLLNLSVSECINLFHDNSKISRPAQTLIDLGLGGLRLGHPLSELSGGEAQRLKLTAYVNQSTKQRCLFLFDEPTTGLHLQDVARFISVVNNLVDCGHSVLCIEHNLELVAANSDWIIDLGPEGGEKGGELVFEGSPDTAIKSKSRSITCDYLRNNRKEKKRSKAKRTKTLGRVKAPSLLKINGAKAHNLKNINLDLPLKQLVALTGVSGSGKSTVAKDIIYAEGQRRYLDCLSPYARQYIKELSKAEVDSIENILPTICVYQHTFRPSKLSTVATMSEVYNYLRLLFSKTGVQHCPEHPLNPIVPLSSRQIANKIRKLPSKSVRLMIPVVKGRKGLHKEVFSRAIEQDISEVRVDGRFSKASKLIDGLERSKVHWIELVTARFNPTTIDTQLLAEEIQRVISLSGGEVVIHADGKDQIFSTARSCVDCGRGFFRPDPEDLSFSSQRGRCEKCHGEGQSSRGVICSACNGSRLSVLGRNLRLDGKNIYELTKMLPDQLSNFLDTLKFESRHEALATSILVELKAKLRTLSNLGLNHIELSRSAHALSSGELQRLRLAAAMGSPLSGVLYIFDEPSVGLHPIDNQKVLEELITIKDRGNSVILIEHDPMSISVCDSIIEMGPGGGHQGGELLYNGSLSKFLNNTEAPTAQALHRFFKPSSKTISKAGLGNKQILKIKKGSYHNVKLRDLNIPLNQLISVAGVSGAGKSSLVSGIIAETLSNGDKQEMKRLKRLRFSFEDNEIELPDEFQRLIAIDQKPIGKTIRSTPASYLGIWDAMRSVFANTLYAKSRGWGSAFFSYNTGKGRCQNCSGTGEVKLEMNFLPDAKITCDMCTGSRYGEEALSVRYREHNIADILNMTFEEAKEFFSNHSKLHRTLYASCEIGLGYLKLGQSSGTLSGGESQRLKLVSELSTKRRGSTIYILDEPTTGLHSQDVLKLVNILKSLVKQGNSVIVIEHDREFISHCDEIIEMGPGPAQRGGKVIFQGSYSQLHKADTPWGEVLGQQRATPKTNWPSQHCPPLGPRSSSSAS